MDLQPAEVTSILKAEIENYKGETSLQSVGTDAKILFHNCNH